MLCRINRIVHGMQITDPNTAGASVIPEVVYLVNTLGSRLSTNGSSAGNEPKGISLVAMKASNSPFSRRATLVRQRAGFPDLHWEC